MVLGIDVEPWASGIVRRSIALTFLALPIVALGCGGEGVVDPRGSRIEGTEPGDCEDGADNDADGFFDCADTSCAASPLCAEGGAGGAGGSGGGSGIGGVGGSMLCAGVDCNDSNECTTDACDPMDGTCDYTDVANGTSCDFGGLPGVCMAGVCEDAMLCASVDCDDSNECTQDVCNPLNGECGYTNVIDDTACDFGSLPGLCVAGVCEDAMLCASVDCDDGNECTEDACDPMDGMCGHTDENDGASCDFGGLPGVCDMGDCQDAMLCAAVDCDDQNSCTEDTCDPMDGSCANEPEADGAPCTLNGFSGQCDGGVCGTSACVTNNLCHTCPDRLLCDTDDDCFGGYVCIASGCDTLQGAAIKQCQPSRGGSCVDEGECPNTRDYDCINVGAGGKRCVRTTPGCDPANETYDCVPGFSCEGGACVDRRVPCDTYLDCPKNHVCSVTPTSSFCVRVFRTCHRDEDCAGFGTFCADIDNDGDKECAGELGSSGEPCVNADCGGSAPMCEAGASGTNASCGDFGLCTGDQCDFGFECVALWQDGRSECVPVGGSCDQVSDCPPQQVCAASRSGAPPSCQAGTAP